MGFFSRRRSTTNNTTQNFTEVHDDDTQQTATSSSLGASVNVSNGGSVTISDAGAIQSNTTIANNALVTADRIGTNAFVAVDRAGEREKELSLAAITELGEQQRRSFETVTLNNVAALNEVRNSVEAIKQSSGSALAQVAAANARAIRSVEVSNAGTVKNIKDISDKTSQLVSDSTGRVNAAVTKLSEKFTETLKSLKETELTDGNSLVLNAVKYWPVVLGGGAIAVYGLSQVGKKSNG